VNISRFMTNTASYAAFTGTDDRDTYQYALPVLIPARVVQKTKTVTTKDGETTTASWTVITQQAINLNDTIDGNVVISVTQMVDYRGNTVGYQALTQ
jgi:hypothetical protein